MIFDERDDVSESRMFTEREYVCIGTLFSHNIKMFSDVFSLYS